MNDLNFNEYLHNFASWTASRAVQRDFTTTSIIKKAIESAKIQSGVQKLNTAKISKKEFDKWHVKTANSLIKNSKRLGQFLTGRIDHQSNPNPIF